MAQNCQVCWIVRINVNPKQTFFFGTQVLCLLVDKWRDEDSFLNLFCLTTNQEKTDDEQKLIHIASVLLNDQEPTPSMPKSPPAVNLVYTEEMKSIRGGTHTTLTETATLVVRALETIPGVTKISPGIITQNGGRTGKSYVTVVFTNAGFELIITGQGVQKVAVHTEPKDASRIYQDLSGHKKLRELSFKTRDRKPGI